MAAVFSLGSFSDPGANDAPWALEVDWDDGWVSADSTGVQGEITPVSHTYASPGTYDVTVTVTDKDGGSGGATFQVTVMTPTATPTPGVCTPPFTPIVANDTDCDCATDADELGTDPVLCGTRDPNNPWDFYNVPAPSIANGGNMTANRDGAVSLLNDVLGVLDYAGTSATGANCNSGPDGIPGNADDRCYTDDLDGDTVMDGMAYDRSSGTGGNNWSDAADDAITILEDVLLVLAQSGAGPCPSLPPP